MKYFGTDGIRGIYGQTIDDDLAYRAGLAAARLFEGECFVGRDTRISGEALCDALICGLVHGGCIVKNLGVIPTPAVSFLAAKYGMGGIMVSASHNPPEYNGLKFFTHTGHKFSSQLESALEEYIDTPLEKAGKGRMVDYGCGKEEYIDRITEGINLEGREVSLDCAYGAAYSVAGEAFLRCGAKARLFAAIYDGSKINCGVGALHPEFIQSVSSGIGFAFDGDADRLAVSCGEILDGDSVLYNLALLIKPKGVVGTVMNNMALEHKLRQNGIDFVRTAVGDKHIGEAMRRYKYTLGGEQSGHYIISPAVSGDALFAALRLCCVKEFVRLEAIPQIICSINAKQDILQNKRFIKAKTECENMLSNKGRLVVRMSGTEPKIRLMAECEDEILIKRIMDILTQTIEICNKEML